MRCKNCGKELKENDRFCRYCGTVIESAETVPARQEQSAQNEKTGQESDEIKQKKPDQDSKPQGNQNTGKKEKKVLIPILIAAVTLCAIIGIFVLKKPNESASGEAVASESYEETASVNSVANYEGTGSANSVEQENNSGSQTEKTTSDKTESEGTSTEGTEEKEFDHNIPVNAINYNGHHYYFYNDVRSSWMDAMEACRNRGGYLAVITDREENNMLFEAMVDQGYDMAYFGLTDSLEEGKWVYLDTDTSDFRNWGHNSVGVQEPNDADNGEDHALLDINMLDGHWNDGSFGKKIRTPEGNAYKDIYVYICEWDH